MPDNEPAPQRLTEEQRSMLESPTAQKVIAYSAKAALKYAKRKKPGHYSLDDAMDYALDIAIVSIRKYDPSKGTRLQTFMSHFSYQYIARCLMSRRKVKTCELDKAKTIAQEVDSSMIDEPEAMDLLKGIPDRTLEIIKLYHGFDDQEPKSLREIGKIYSISAERVRQILEVGLERLREKAEGRL